MNTPESDGWHKTACIICALNCGLEVQTNNKDRRITKIRGDRVHPISQGYVCEKSQRMDYYQNGADRLNSPMRRRSDGSYEAIDWETAIREIAQKFKAIRDTHGGESILYFAPTRAATSAAPTATARRRPSACSTAPTRSRRRRPASSGSLARC